MRTWKKNASQLFFTGDIENINQAINIYEKYDKTIPLKWSICTSTDILRINLEKIEKYLLSTFYLRINFFKINIPDEENIKLLIKNTKKELQFLLGSKKF